MAKRFLVALDKSNNSLRAVKFVATTISPEATVTLISIVSDPAAACELRGPSLASVFTENMKTFCVIEDAKKAALEGFLEEAKKTLIKAGFAPKNVAVRIRKQKAGVARDILSEAKRGKYDAVVVGRRGVSGVRQFVFGSVSNKIVNRAEKVSVIVVD
ncbi:MAG: universal stress protein [Deltaproteobacteria bacterium]|nr:universal stress protein [Deltaproteobacteria bacterium]